MDGWRLLFSGGGLALMDGKPKYKRRGVIVYLQYRQGPFGGVVGREDVV